MAGVYSTPVVEVTQGSMEVDSQGFSLESFYNEVELPSSCWTKLYKQGLVSYFRLNDSYNVEPRILCMVTFDSHHTLKIFHSGSWHSVDIAREFGHASLLTPALFSRYLKIVEQRTSPYRKLTCLARDIENTMTDIKNSESLFKKRESIDEQLTVLKFFFEQVRLLGVAENFRKWPAKILKLALTVYYHSMSAYSALRDSGQILMPNLDVILRYQLPMDNTFDQGSLTNIRKNVSDIVCTRGKRVVIIVEELVITSEEKPQGQATITDTGRKRIFLIFVQSISMYLREFIGFVQGDDLNQIKMKKLYEQVISVLEQCGCLTEGLVMEFTDFNMEILREFGVKSTLSSSSASISHPCGSNRKFSFIFDPLQVIERIREDWQKNEFFIMDGESMVSFHYIQKMYQYQSLSIYNKPTISECIIREKNLTWQEIHQALTVFSNSTIQGLESCIDECKEFCGAQETVDFLKCFFRLCCWLDVNLSQKDKDEFSEHTCVYTSSSDFRFSALESFIHWIMDWNDDNKHYVSKTTLIALLITLTGILDIMRRCLEDKVVNSLSPRIFQLDAL